ncbi:4Fe-4S dicluster domain-containing protein [Selenomonas sp. WCT3]|uniref:polysaccharide pyruvyl transferase family protein n=1 Tax=Selenomonas sp. WCT3 TaxID=3158785 RepID=UPI00088B552F|nr:4Fe-4S dicluster domain-containing protein [Selenomonas ruminantium]
MKKVGLMTWYKYKNFGTALQVVSLSCCIKELGYSTEILNYTPRTMGNYPNYNFTSLMKRLLRKIMKAAKKEQVIVSRHREELFDNFIAEHLTESQTANNAIELESLSNDMDAVVCGSDQIWAPSCFDDKYFLSFVHDVNKMISYAPSIGLTHIDSLLVAEEMAALISRFKHLSVREQQGAELIKKLCGRKAEVVLDPTLLHDIGFWNQITYQHEVPDGFMNRPYIIAYFLGKPNRYLGVLRKAEQTYGMPVFLIPVFKVQYSSKYCLPFEIGPAEFVQLIAHAKYVLTDSFHGLAFSVNFNKPFTVFKRFKDGDKTNQNSRILNLLSLMGLNNRLCDAENYVPKKNDFLCDFSQTNTAMEKLRLKSVRFLKGSLEQATADNSKPASVGDLKFCCGCGSCKSQCPTQAISIQKNENGFWEKFVDKTKCIHCKKCLMVCPFYQVEARSMREMKKLVAYKSRCLEKVRTESSSGAVGADLVQVLLDDGYTISGCVYDRTMNQAEHIWFDKESADKAEWIKGSKYIQSSTTAVMDAVAHQEFNQIAFFGTPCQVAAMDKLLRRTGKRTEAVLIDLICHGVPSQHLWDKYIAYIDRWYHTGHNPDVKFRSPDTDWRALSLSVNGNKNRYIKNEKKDLFYAFFRPSLCYMPSCYECPYREKSAADIRIGDYWGERFVKDSTGVSMVTIHTEKGNQIMKKLSGWMEEFCVSEYWSVQYPYNHQPPIFYHELIRKLKTDGEDLYSLYTKYAIGYAKREKLVQGFNFIKKFVRMWMK